MRIAIDALAGSIADGRHDNDLDLSWLYGMTQLGILTVGTAPQKQYGSTS